MKELVAFKVCKHCLVEKPIADIKFKSGRATCYCRYCYNRYKKGGNGRKTKGLYTADPITHKTSLTAEHRKEVKRLCNRRHDEAKRQLCYKFMKEFLDGKCCMDCGYSNVIALDMDHRDPNEKKHGISTLTSGGRLRQLKEEIEKCDVVCANCHRIRTAKMFGSWRLDLVASD